MKAYHMGIFSYDRDRIYEERYSDSWEEIFRTAVNSLANYEPGEVYAYIGKNTGWTRGNKRSYELVCLELVKEGEILAVEIFFDMRGFSHRNVRAEGKKEAYEILKEEAED